MRVGLTACDFMQATNSGGRSFRLSSLPSGPTKPDVRRSMATWTLLHAALLGVGSAHGASEDASGDWLEWIRAQGSASCPDTTAFVAKIETHLGHSPAQAAGESKRRLVARIQREASAPWRWLAAVEVFDFAGKIVGRRTIAKTSDACEPAADALALVAALILSDPSLAESEAPPANPTPLLAEHPSEATTTSSAPVPVLALSSDPPAKPRRWAVAIDGGIAAAIGILPGLNLGGEIRLAFAPPAWPVLYTTFALWRENTKTIATGRGANLDLWTAGLGACPVYARSVAWALGLCAGVDLGRLRAAGFGFSTPASDTQWTFDLSAGTQLQRRLAAGFSAALGLEIVLPVTKGRVAYAGAAGETVEVWRASPVAGAGSLRLGYAFW